MNKLRKFNPSGFDPALYQRLSRGVRTKESFGLGRLVNFLDAERFPVHRWVFLREGFSPQLVDSLLREWNVGRGGIVLDPFLGGGTTAIAARDLGVNSVGFEVNPLMSFVSKAKSRAYGRRDFDEISSLVSEMRECRFRPSIEAPILPDVNKIFHDDRESVLEKLLMYREFIMKAGPKTAGDFLLLGWLSVLEKLSNTRKGGMGLRTEKRFGKNVRKTLFEKYEVMLSDLKMMAERPRPAAGIVVHEGSFTAQPERLADDSIDAVITSPPYPNCFDYLGIYAIELWMGDFIRSEEDAQRISASSVRSHLNMNLKRQGSCKNAEVMEAVNGMLKKVPKAHLWDQRIPLMMRGYFDDMGDAISLLYRKLKRGGKCAMVVGNVSYGGVVFPVDLLLSRIALDAGFSKPEIRVARLLNTELSPEQLKAGGSFLRESVIVMEK